MPQLHLKQIVWFLNPLKFAFQMITATITLRSLNYNRNDHMKFINFVFDVNFQLAERLIYTVYFYHQIVNSLLCVIFTPKAAADASSVFLGNQVWFPAHAILQG